MDYKEVYHQATLKTSKLLTKHYSTSFYMATCLFSRLVCQHIFNIYGMVRLADEIVDTFSDHSDVQENLRNFIEDTWKAIKNKYSANLVLHAFQYTYHTYGIEKEHITAFFSSMEMDIAKRKYTDKELEEYVYGSAEVIGLMCLKVFCGTSNSAIYHKQKPHAIALGNAFQKINFLRDLAVDYQHRGRAYFSDDLSTALTEEKKESMVGEVYQNLLQAKRSLSELPKQSRYGVLASILLYGCLLKKIKRRPVDALFQRRLSVSSFQKYYIWLRCFLSRLL